MAVGGLPNCDFPRLELNGERGSRCGCAGTIAVFVAVSNSFAPLCPISLLMLTKRAAGHHFLVAGFADAGQEATYVLVAIALANKMARKIWAMLTKMEDYRDPVVAHIKA